MVELLEKQKKISALKPSSLNPVYKISSASKTACVLQKRIKELPSPHGIQSKTIRVFSGEAQVSSNKLPKIGSTDSKKSNAEIRTKNYTNVVRLPRIASGKESRDKSIAKGKWIRAERRLTVLSTLTAQARESHHEVNPEEENEEKKQFRALLATLPHVTAHLKNASNADEFWQIFMDDALNESSDVAEICANIKKTEPLSVEETFDLFLRFCRLHADFEQQRRIYYSMCARQLVKERQLELLRKERETYKERAHFVEKLLKHCGALQDNKRIVAHPSLKESTHIQQCFWLAVEHFAEMSFSLCSKKSRLEFLEGKMKLKENRVEQRMKNAQRESLDKELRFLQKQRHILDLRIWELFN